VYRVEQILTRLTCSVAYRCGISRDWVILADVTISHVILQLIISVSYVKVDFRICHTLSEFSFIFVSAIYSRKFFSDLFLGHALVPFFKTFPKSSNWLSRFFHDMSIRGTCVQSRWTDSSSRWEKDSVRCAIDKSPGPVMEKGESSSASLWLVISARQDPSSYYGLMAAPLTKSINEGGVPAALRRLVNVSTFVYFAFSLCFPPSLRFPLCLLVFFFPFAFLPPPFSCSTSWLLARSCSTDIIQSLITYVTALVTDEDPSIRS